MAVNQKNTTIASFNYLIELSTISLHTRNEYRDILLKRKNSARQKNVKLLKCIYEYIDENRLSEWNSEDVCRKTGLNMNSLYIQKSRLLKGLREFAFGWKETAKEIETRVKEKFSDGSFHVVDEDTIAILQEKAQKMVERGMMREAKCMYIKLEKTTKASSLNLAEMYLILSEIYEYLAYYYFNKRQKRRLLYYIQKLKSTTEAITALNIKIPPETDDLLSIRLNFSRFYIYCMKWYSDSGAIMNGDFMEKVYSLSKESDNYTYLLKVLHGMAILELTKENSNKMNLIKAKQICTEGFEAAQKSKNRTAQYTFASMLHYIKNKLNPRCVRPGNESIVSYYHKIKKTNPFNIWTIYLENSIVMTYYPEKRNEILYIFRQQVASNVMYGDFAFSVYWKFTLDSEMYNDKLISYFNNYNIYFKGYLEIKKIDDALLDDIKKICLNTECYHTNINDFGLEWLVQKLKLTTYYFREDGYDYNEVTGQLKVMEHLKKKSKIKQGLRTYELLKLCMEMLELEDDHKSLLDKYELDFKKAIDEFINNPEELTLTDYAIVSSLSRRLRCKEITAIVKDFYHWLENNRPEILAPAIRDIEERKARIKLFDGSKQTAA